MFLLWPSQALDLVWPFLGDLLQLFYCGLNQQVNKFVVLLYIQISKNRTETNVFLLRKIKHN